MSFFTELMLSLRYLSTHKYIPVYTCIIPETNIWNEKNSADFLVSIIMNLKKKKKASIRVAEFNFWLHH